MRNPIFSFLLLVVVACASLQFMGCCVIGMTIGAIADSGTPDEIVLPVSKLDALERGDTVSVRSRDSTLAKGEYAGLEVASDAEYAEHYKQHVSASPSAPLIPCVGDSVTIITGGMKHNQQRGRVAGQGRLTGFDPGIIIVQPYGTRKLTEFRLDTVYAIYYDRGKVLTSETLQGYMNTLQQYIDAGNIPSMSCALVVCKPDTVRIPLDQIIQINQKVSKTKGTWRGFIYGAVVDIVLVAALYGGGPLVEFRFPK